MFEPISDLVADKNWFARVDKNALCGICNAQEIKIEDKPEFGREAYGYMDPETKRGLFVVLKRSDSEGRATMNFLRSPDKGAIGSDIREVKVNILPGYESVYYERGPEQKNLMVCGSKYLEFTTTKLSKEQLLKVVQHFADKKIF